MPEEVTSTQTDGAESSPAGFSPITTQEEFNAAIKARLERQQRSFEEAHREEFEKARAYDEIQEGNKTELEKAQERTAELENELEAIRKRDQLIEWKREISKQTGVPEEVLRGDTWEEIEAHADSLRSHIAQARPGFVSSDGFAPSKTESASTASQFAAALDGII